MKRVCLAASAAALATMVSGSALAAPVQWGGNGHWYEFVRTPVDWDTAFAAAAASSHLGEPGYLATITSAGENTFAATVAEGILVWIGGSDRDGEGAWTWEGGPELDQLFTYTNWNPGEPNDCCGGEDYLQLNWAVFGGWNDHGGPGNPGQLNGYLIEYNGERHVPEPGAIGLLGLGLVASGIAARRRKG